MTIITIPIPTGPIAEVDEKTGDILVTREWYKYFTLLVKALGNSTDYIVDSAFAQSQISNTNALFDRIRVAEQLAMAGLVRQASVPFANTTDQLTGTASQRAATPDSVAALWEKGTDIASANPLAIGEGGFFHVTGTTNFSDIDFDTDKTGRAVWLIFDDVLTITHHATTLILPGGANITTAAGDAMLVVSEGSDAVRVPVYYRKSGAALTAGVPLANAHILVGNASNVATDVAMSGDATIANTGALTIANGAVTEAKQTLADNTTNDVSTTKHGYAPKGDGSTTKFLNANGAYSTPSGGGGSAGTAVHFGATVTWTANAMPTGGFANIGASIFTIDHDTEWDPGDGGATQRFWLGRDFTFVDADVNVTDNTIAETGHGFTTGEGPFRLTNSGGALPGGTATATNYWAIVVDANTFKLASSRANAIAGTPVDITSAAGGGTHTCDRGSFFVIPAGVNYARFTARVSEDSSTLTGVANIGYALEGTGLRNTDQRVASASQTPQFSHDWRAVSANQRYSLQVTGDDAWNATGSWGIEVAG